MHINKELKVATIGAGKDINKIGSAAELKRIGRSLAIEA